MTDTATTPLPIGAVTRLTGISGHTLRKWESRYDAVEPVRTDTGRRLYTQAHVRRLKLFRDLIRKGHQIGQLAQLEDAELDALAAAQPGPLPEAPIDCAIVVGRRLAAMLSQEKVSDNLTVMSVPADQWLLESTVPETSGASALVVELQTLSEQSIDRLLRLRRDHFDRIIAVYGFSSSKQVRRLLDGGILCLKAPTSASEILRNLALTTAQTSIVDLLEDQAIPAHRFSDESITSLAALSPKLQCECPNHIAQLLLDIGAFEQYSMECEDSDPKERALHARLRLISAHARALFEEAMAEVAANEGLELEEIS